MEGRPARVGSDDPPAVVKVGGRRFAVHLHWQTLEDDQTIRQKMAQNRAEPDKPDYWLVYRRAAAAWRTAGDIQIGLGRKELGHRRGYPSLAAAFALAHPSTDSDVGDDCGLFDIGDGLYYIVAVVDGRIDADTDLLYADRERAIEEFASLLSRADHNWRSVYCPADLGYDGSRDATLDDVITTANAKRVPALRELLPVTLIARVMGAFAIIAILLGGYTIWHHHEDRIALRLAKDRALAFAHFRAEQEARARAMAGPWRHEPIFAAALTACVTETDRLALTVPGWSLRTMTCNGKTLVADYGMAGGTIAWLYNVFPSVPIKWEGKSATVTWEIQGLQTAANQNPSPDLRYMTEWLGAHLQEAFATWGIHPGKAPGVGRPGTHSPVAGIFFPTMDVTVKSPISPLYLLPILDQVPTLVLDKAVYTTRTGGWVLKAHFYGKLIKTQENRR